MKSTKPHSKGALLMNILQQIIDNSTDFFNYALKKMETPDYGMHQLMPEAQHFANNLVTMMVSPY